MNTKIIDSLIFDLDGTLWDASATCAAAWKETLKQSGVDDFVFDEAKVRSVSGLRVEKIVTEHFSFLPEEKHAGLLTMYQEQEARAMKKLGGKLFPQAKETLSELVKSYGLFVVSNCNKGYIENFPAFHNLQHLFTDFECSGATGLPKSDNIRLIVDRNRIARPVYIGDTVWDQEAALTAGIPFIYTAYGFGKAVHSPYRIETLSELPAFLSRLQPVPAAGKTE